jgi:FkbM family methyltransferase
MMWSTVKGLKSRIGRVQRASGPVPPADGVAFIAGHLAEFEWLYLRLADDASRGVLLALLRARLLGLPYRHPSRDSAVYRQAQRRVAPEFLVERDTRRPWLPYLNRYCVAGSGGKIVLQSDEPPLLHTFLLEQYAYRQDGTTICAGARDIVIDGGSKHGTSALYFADRVGAAGHVYAVELGAGNAALIGENLVLNPRLQDQVTVLERALSDSTGDRVYYRPSGPVSQPVRIDQWGMLSVNTETVSIDDLVEQERLQRLDFLKLDIGGWEHRALTGARRTLAQFQPTLAIALTQELADLIDIPSYLDSVVERYDFFLHDVTPQGDHPILFARPPARAAQR